MGWALNSRYGSHIGISGGKVLAGGQVYVFWRQALIYFIKLWRFLTLISAVLDNGDCIAYLCECAKSLDLGFRFRLDGSI